MKERSFSLIEVVVAIAILSLILGGMLGIFWQGFNAAKKSQERTVAYSLAREIIEENFRFPFPSNSSGTVTRNGINYNWTLNVSDGPINPSTLKQLTVTISWGTETYSLTTLKADY